MKNNVSKMVSNKKFGNFFSLIFLIVCLFFIYKENIGIAIPFALLSILTFFLVIFIPGFLKPFNFLWFRFGLLLHYIVSPIILRLLGRDELKLKPTNHVSSWNKYKNNRIVKNNFKDQF